MAITFSKMGDTAGSMTHDLLGHSDDSFAQKLWQQNAGFNCRRLGTATQFAPGYAVWVPEENHPMGSQAAALQMPYFDALMPHHLEGLAAAQADGLNPQILLGAHELACRLNYSYFNMAAEVSDDPEEKANYLDQATSFALTAMHTGLDLRKNVSVDIGDKIKKLNKTTLDERSYRRSKSSIEELDEKVLKRLKDARNAAMQELQKYSESFFNDKQATYLLHKSEAEWEEALGRKKWILSDVFDTADLASVAEVLEYVGYSVVGLDVIVGGFDVYEKWKEGKDWEYEMLQDAADIAISAEIGIQVAGVAALFVGGGWVVCLAIGVTAAVASGVLNHYGNKILEKELKPFIDKIRIGN